MKIALIHTKAETPIGTMDVLSSERGVIMLLFEDMESVRIEMARLAKKMNAEIAVGENRHTLELKKQLREYFTGNRQNFSVPLQLTGTDFQNEVWSLTRKIPYGKTISYRDQTLKIRDIKSVRAVGRANGLNRLLIVVPCHRVISSGGKLNGYAGGLDRKRFLLNLERSGMGLRDLFS